MILSTEWHYAVDCLPTGTQEDVEFLVLLKDGTRCICTLSYKGNNLIWNKISKNSDGSLVEKSINNLDIQAWSYLNSKPVTNKELEWIPVEVFRPELPSNSRSVPCLFVLHDKLSNKNHTKYGKFFKVETLVEGVGNVFVQGWATPNLDGLNRYTDKEYSSYGETTKDFYVTHWMPVPELLKENK